MLGLSPWLALPLSFLIGILLGLVVERTLMRRSYSGLHILGDHARRIRPSSSPFALSIFLINLVDKIVGPYAFKGPALIDISRITIGPIAISGHRLIRCARRGRGDRRHRDRHALHLLGAAIQAVFAEPLGASLAGIDPAKAKRHRLRARGRACRVSGALLANIFNPTPRCRLLPAIKSYVIVVLGGMGSVPGSILRASCWACWRVSAGFIFPISTATHSVSSF